MFRARPGFQTRIHGSTVVPVYQTGSCRNKNRTVMKLL
ncbi:Uncharacterized protein dnm_046710 [Desulfonema magnum]|uniref:Uncharacterized protein n=1 Tax=Desulfonema magnum TaxID=45655 RepID=A0A975BMV0_9BACT|nr:Uncharacterized protein dnm_046710 [Desulfonema magnum]